VGRFCPLRRLSGISQEGDRHLGQSSRGRYRVRQCVSENAGRPVDPGRDFAGPYGHGLATWWLSGGTMGTVPSPRSWKAVLRNVCLDNRVRTHWSTLGRTGSMRSRSRLSRSRSSA
jgi:hypothetical protein